MPRPSRAVEGLLLPVALAAVPALVLAFVQASWSLPFFSDDAFISLRYAARLLAGDGLTWTDGERVEGYSNLLWVLACAGLGALGLDLVAAARLLGGACTALSLLVLAAALPVCGRRDLLPAAAGPLLVAASAPVMAWTLGGLEGPLVLLLLCWGLGRLLRSSLDEGPLRALSVAGGLPFALLCLTRPDGPLWCAVAGTVLAGAALRSGKGPALRGLLRFSLLPLLAVAAQTAFRWLYYGDLVPNTAHVKLTAGSRVLVTGLEHVGHGLLVLGGLVLPAVFGAAWALLHRSTRAPTAALGATVVAWLCYLASVGGDHFPGFRLFHGVLAPLGLLAMLGLRRLAGSPRGPLPGAAITVAAATALVLTARLDPLSAFVRTETWEWRAKVVGEVLRDAFGDASPRLAVDAAGAVPHYSGLPALDMLGLCDRTIARSPSPPFAAIVAAMHGRELLPGHMLGNGDHVMAQQPDLMLFGQPPGLPLGVFASALDFEADPRFLLGYRCVRIETGERLLWSGAREALRIPLWVRLEGRVGLQRRPEHVVVPAFLLGSYRQPYAFRFAYAPVPRDDPRFPTWDRDLRAAWDWFMVQDDAVATIDERGKLQLELRSDQPAALELDLPQGGYEARAVPAAEVSIELQFDAGGMATLRAMARPGADLPQRIAAIELRRLD